MRGSTGCGDKEFHLGHEMFEMPVVHPGRDAQWGVSPMSLKLESEIVADCVDVSTVRIWWWLRQGEKTKLKPRRKHM